MYLTDRERRVLEILLQTDKAITIKEIANQFDVSDRTIHRDLNNLKATLNDYHMTLHKQTGVGIRMTGEHSRKKELEGAISTTSVSEFIPEERRAIILLMLLKAAGPMKLFTLASNIQVTTATVSNDLDQLEDKIRGWDLHLIRKRGYGVQLEGNEKNKRVAIITLMTEYTDPTAFISIVKTNLQRNRPKTTAISNRLLGLVNNDRLHIIEQRVEKTRGKLHYELADSAYIGLVTHLALVVERLKQGDSITFNPSHLNRLKESPEFEIAKQLIRELEQDLQMTFPDDEVGYITMHLMGAKMRADQHQPIMDVNQDVAYRVGALIQYVDERMNYNLAQHNSLFHDLVIHLQPAIYRLEQGLAIHNPLIKEIKNDYGDLFQLLREAVENVYPDIVFPDAEIGYLVLHFASIIFQEKTSTNLRALVICSSGIGTAKILATKLKQHIPEIKHIENVSMFDVDEYKNETYDITISTIPLPETTHDYILTSPMLTEEELAEIKRAIKRKQLTTHDSRSVDHDIPENNTSSDYLYRLEKINRYSRAIVDVLQSLAIQNVPGNRDLSAIIRYITEIIADNDVLKNPNIVWTQLMDRQEKNGVGIPHTGLALFHTRTDEIVQPSFTIHPVEYPVSIKAMDNMEIKVTTFLFMLAPRNPGQEVLETLSYLSSLLVNVDSAPILKSGDINRIQHYLSKHFYSWLQTKI